MTGRWKTIARRSGGNCSRLPHVMRPSDGGASPIATLSRVVLPEPFGPINTVGDPESIVSVTRFNIFVSCARTWTSENTIGKSLGYNAVFMRPVAPRLDALPTRAH